MDNRTTQPHAATPRDAYGATYAPTPSATRADELASPAQEDAYWREAYADEPYVRPDFKFEDYEPAYRIGYLGASRPDAGEFDDAEPMLREQYERVRGGSPLQWHAARIPARAAWDRVSARRNGKA